MFNYKKTYYKFIGNNCGNYPYKIGLNRIEDNDEIFNPEPVCDAGALYFCDIGNLFLFADKGDILCVIEIPEEAKVVRIDEKYKTNMLFIRKFISCEGRHISLIEEIKIPYFACVDFGAKLRNGDFKKAQEILDENNIDISYIEDLWRYMGLYCKDFIGICRFLLKNKLNINYKNDIYLKNAVENGNLKCVDFLYRNGANFNSLSLDEIHDAFKKKKYDIVLYIEYRRKTIFYQYKDKTEKYENKVKNLINS